MCKLSHSQWVANLSSPELGTAQPQLVYGAFLFISYFGGDNGEMQNKKTLPNINSFKLRKSHSRKMKPAFVIVPTNQNAP